MTQQILSIIRSAGEIMLKAHDISNSIENKQGNANFVTKYDYAVQEFLQRELARVVPDAVFIGEEGEEDKLYDHEKCFIIDPIDGTTNFIFDYRHSSISVALMKQGRPEFGAVYDPYLDELFYAVKGKGVFLQRKSHSETNNGTDTSNLQAAGGYVDQPLNIINLPLKEGITCFGTSPYYRELTEASFELAKKLFLHSLDIRRSGSAALDLSYVAAGRYVLFAEYVLQPWDYAAASLIVEEAGGILLTLEGMPLPYDKPCTVLAGTPQSIENFREL